MRTFAYPYDYVQLQLLVVNDEKSTVEFCIFEQSEELYDMPDSGIRLPGTKITFHSESNPELCIYPDSPNESKFFLRGDCDSYNSRSLICSIDQFENIILPAVEALNKDSGKAAIV